MGILLYLHTICLSIQFSVLQKCFLNKMCYEFVLSIAGDGTNCAKVIAWFTDQ